jgi:hypothetical protein
MPSARLSRRVEKVVGYPPLSEMSERQRSEFHEALLDGDTFEELPGKWQAAILNAEANRPKRGRASGPDVGDAGRASSGGSLEAFESA